MQHTELDKLNLQLPAGIKAAYVGNSLHFTVRTSHKGKKYSLGTFVDMNAAIKALTEFKIKQSYTIAAKDIADRVSCIVAEQQHKVENKIKEAQKQTPQVQDVELLRNYVNMHGPHLLGSGHESINITCEDGTVKYISKDIVAILYAEIWGM